MKQIILSLADPAATLETVGGKGMSLARLSRAGLPVPPGFHITTAAYRQFIAENDLQEPILAHLAACSPADMDSLEAASRQISQMFSTAAIPSEIAAAIAAALAHLGSQPVAVRSSATAEDLPEASFAGQQETYLNIQGEDAVLQAVRRCWASLWTARAIAYRARQGIPAESVALAVVVQALVPADAAGVLFTANPVNGRRGEMLVNAVWGLGEALVSGAVSPDTLTLDKQTGKILHQSIASKQVMTVRTPTGTCEQPVPARLIRKAVLGKAQAARLVEIGRQIESLYGMPMDVEWTLAEGKIAIVQARPITSLPPEWQRPNPKTIYARGSLAEHLPNPVTPLYGTLGLRLANLATTEMALGLGFDPATLDYQYRAINGYVYLGFQTNPGAMWKMIAATAGSFKMMLSDGRPRWQAASQEVSKVLALWESRDLSSCTCAELLAGIEAILLQSFRLYTVLQSGTLPAATSSESVLTMFYRMVRRKNDPPVTAFLFGAETTPLRAEKSLYDLAAWLRQQPSLAAWITEAPTASLLSALALSSEHAAPPAGIPADEWNAFREKFQAHLITYGQTAYELDFANPTPLEDPSPMLEAIKTFLAKKGSNPYTRQADALAQREQATRTILSRLPWPLKGWFAQTLQWAQNRGPAREDSLVDLGMANPQVRRMLAVLGSRLALGGALEAAKDIYWLEEAEIRSLSALIDSHQSLPDLRYRAKERREEWQTWLKLFPPAMLPETSGWTKIMPWHKDDRSSKVISGYASSPGRVTAPACVLLSPDDFGKMKPGAALVAVTTTPAWTPLFTMASAVVTDIGGPLSHSSIVAREYGIPAVLSTGIGSRRIRDGQLITVDGSAGKVILED